MKFIDLVLSRQSDRAYSNQPVHREDIVTCIKAARLAPSASNSQPWTFIIVDQPELKDQVASATWSKLVKFNKFTHQAHALVVMVLEKPRMITRIGGAVKNREFPLIDIGIAAEHFCLQAAELGLGTCMMGWFNEKKVKNLLKIPKNKRLALVISIGYPNGKHREKIRKPMEEICTFNRYPENKS